MTLINPDLIAERKKCTFDPTELTHLLDGGREKTEERRSRGINGIKRMSSMNVIYDLFQKNFFWKILNFSQRCLLNI